MSRYISRTYNPDSRNRQVFQRGKGSILVYYPDVADPDRVTQAWLQEYRKELPRGTIVVQNGVRFTV